MTDSLWLWVGFNVFVLAMLALDLGVFHRKAHELEAVFLADQSAQHWSPKSLKPIYAPILNRL